MIKWRTPNRAELRHCAKLALAAIAAYTLTLGDNNAYALYTMLGAVLVVGGSIGEDLSTSFSRLKGTLAGAVTGGIAVYVLGLSIWSLGLAVAALAWLSAGLALSAPALRVGIAMALVVVFTYSADAAQHSLWRLLNAVIGVIIGIAISYFVWPVRGRDDVGGAIEKAQAATDELLDALARATPPEDLRPLQLQVLDALTALRTARKNASVEWRIAGKNDVMAAHTAAAASAAIAALGASLKLEEAVQDAPAGDPTN